MNRPLRTDRACTIFESIKLRARNSLRILNERCCLEAESVINELKEALIREKQAGAPHEENLLNDLFVLDRYGDFLASYAAYWKCIIDGRFSDSWSTLQDALNLLRVLKKFSNIEIGFFERQLLELEKTYPYNVFFSIGATVERFVCSICSEDIDSSACNHMRGELYRGVMAHAIARNIIEMTEVSMVSNPEDKRCVVAYDDAGEHFKLVRYLSELVTSGQIPILNFERLVFSKRKHSNPEYRKLRRNESCFCRSGKKFKKCCKSKQYVEGDHVDIIGSPRLAEDAIV